jgi:hypothetical protein
MAEQAGASEPLGGATTAQGADKEPSPTLAALASRRERGKKCSIDEECALMGVYDKKTFDSERGATITVEVFSEKLFKGFLSSPRYLSGEQYACRGAKHGSL